MLLDEQWPPVQVSDYVPLILSLSDTSDFSEEVVTDKINKILKGDVDHVSNSFINFSDIFKSGNCEIINSILVQGSPGVGKTAFSLTVCKKWAAGELFTQFKIVLLWSLRDLQIGTFTSIDDLFFHDSSDVSASVIKEVRKSGGKDVLFVLDGWDELPAKLTKSRGSCFFLKLIEGSELPFSSIIVTSRNVSSQKLLRQSFFNRTIDILGFSPECINEYIGKCFRNKPSDEQNLKKLLSERPDINSICYIPMNCSIVCYVYSSCKKNLPSTLTELYSLLAQNSLLRNVDLRGNVDHEVDFNYQNLPDDAKALYLSLCKLAYHGISISRYTYSRNDIAAACESSTGVIIDVDKLGILQAVNVFHSEGVSSSFHFLHTTLQEFMAASYIASLEQGDFQRVVDHHFSKISFKMVWQFYSGLIKGMCTNPMKNQFIACLQEEAREAATVNSEFHDRFSDCNSDEELYSSESESEEDEDEVLEEVLEEENFLELSTCTEVKPLISQCPDEVGLSDSTNDEAVKSFEELPAAKNEIALPFKSSSTDVSTNCETALLPSTELHSEFPRLPSTTLCFTSGGAKSLPLVTTGGLEGISSTISNARAIFVTKVDPYKQYKSQILFILRCAHETQYQRLCSSLCDILSSLLFFSKLSLSPEDINAIGFVMARSNRKWQLHLVNCNLNNSHLAMLCHQFLKKSFSGRLTRLHLNGNGLEYTSMEVLIKMLPALKPLQKLFLGSNDLCDKSFESGFIPTLLNSLHSLCCLDLASNNITDHGIEILMRSLISLKYLTHLDISNNSVSSEGASFVANSFSTWQYLDIHSNRIEDIGVQHLSASLNSSSLQYLDLSNTGTSDEGVAILSSALQCNFSLQTLILHSNNDITHEGVGILLESGVHSHLSKLDISFCQTGWSVEMINALMTTVPSFSTLLSLDLSYNDLEDEGISALISAISNGSNITKLFIGGNSISSQTIQLLGYMICENSNLKKIGLIEDDLVHDIECLDEFCDCLTANNSLQSIEICGNENEQLLKEKFKHVNNCRKSFDKNKLKVNFFSD